MARTTPTFTPIRNYAIGFFLSACFLFSDINYGSFSELRGNFKAGTLYIQIISKSLLQSFGDFTSTFKEARSFAKENKKLKEQIYQLQSKQVMEKIDYSGEKKLINLYENMLNRFKTDIHIHKIASIDLRNYLCCASHKIFLQNPQKVQIKENYPVLAGESFIGQTTKSYFNLIEVILFSDTNHILPIKSDYFFCNARGKGKPLLISCRLNQNFKEFKHINGDPIFTSGLGGIFLKDIHVGSISEIVEISKDELEVTITLLGNPLKENFYGIMKSMNDEVK